MAYVCSIWAALNLTLHKQTEKQQEQYLKPLMEGKIRSSFAMTEKNKCSSDAKNISGTILREGNEFVINAHKQWTSGAGDPRLGVYILVGKT
jgi:acyl-CoA dehydrogenase